MQRWSKKIIHFLLLNNTVYWWLMVFINSEWKELRSSCLQITHDYWDSSYDYDDCDWHWDISSNLICTERTEGSGGKIRPPPLKRYTGEVRGADSQPLKYSVRTENESPPPIPLTPHQVTVSPSASRPLLQEVRSFAQCFIRPARSQ